MADDQRIVQQKKLSGDANGNRVGAEELEENNQISGISKNGKNSEPGVNFYLRAGDQISGISKNGKPIAGMGGTHFLLP